MGEIADDCYDRMFDDYNQDRLEEEYQPRSKARCNRCGSADVRWRQQGGRWVLFNLGVGEHVCPIDDSSFGVVES